MYAYQPANPLPLHFSNVTGNLSRGSDRKLQYTTLSEVGKKEGSAITKALRPDGSESEQ